MSVASAQAQIATAAVLAAAPVIQSMNPDGVVLCAILGAMAASWLRNAKTFEPTRRWIVGAVSTAITAVLTGVVTPYALFAMAASPNWPSLTPVLGVPPYIIALTASSCSVFLIAIAIGAVRSRFPSIFAPPSAATGSQKDPTS